MSKKILKCSASHRNILVGALIGAMLTSVIVVIPVSSSFIKFGLLHGGVIFLMIKTGLRIKGNRGVIKAYVVIYISTFLIGGIFSGFSQYIWRNCCFFVFAGISYLSALKIWDFLRALGRQNNTTCEVLLIDGKNQIKVHALIDTGNQLRDPVTRKPVSIVSRQTARKLWQEMPEEGVRYIPYHSIGKKEGILPVFVLDKMCLYLEEEVWIMQSLIAVGEETLSAAGYEMILNPDIK